MFSSSFLSSLTKKTLVSCTGKKTNEWVLNIVEIKRKLLDTVKARKLAWLHHKETRELPGEIDNAINNT